MITPRHAHTHPDGRDERDERRGKDRGVEIYNDTLSAIDVYRTEMTIDL